MASRTERSAFNSWWWTVDRLMLITILALMLIGIVLLLAARRRTVRIGNNARVGISINRSTVHHQELKAERSVREAMKGGPSTGAMKP